MGRTGYSPGRPRNPRRPRKPLTPKLPRLAADLDKIFAAEDREIVKEAKREREMDEARRAVGVPPKKQPAREIRTYGFGGTAAAPH